MKILIIEDEELAAAKLEGLIHRYDQSYLIVDKLRSVKESVSWFRANKASDLLFLDIHLLDGTCFDILKEVDIKCPVIFTTAYEDYVFESFKVYNIDYLIKPVSFKKIEQSLGKFEKLVEQHQKPMDTGQFKEMLQAIRSVSKEYKSRFLVKFGSRLLPLEAKQVAYFYSKERITFLVTDEGKKYPISNTLEELEESLDPSLFFRINRQIILHIQSIRQVHKYFKGRLKVDLQLETDQEVMVSSRRASEFQKWMEI
jgi:DNA-binding LytR/AlgR family response regulator